MIVLYEWFRNSEVRKRALVVAFQKEAAVVAEHARFEEQKAGEAGSEFFHRAVFIMSFSTATKESLIKCLGSSVHPCVPRGSRFSMVLNQSFSKLEHAFPQQLQQIGAISIVAHRLRQRFQLCGGDVPGSISDFLGASDHQALAFLQRLNK